MFLVEYNNHLLFLEFICVLIGFVCVLKHDMQDCKTQNKQVKSA